MADQKLDGRQSGRIVGRILPAAVRLWLRSQAEQIESLSVVLSGRDREIISGYLPGISLEAKRVIYQGIHLSKLYLSAKDIRINVGQVVRGKPLRLLKTFPVVGSVVVTEDDLNASLASPLLTQGLSDFWRSLARQPSIYSSVQSRYGALPLSPAVVLEDAQIKLIENRLGLRFHTRVENVRSERPVVFAASLIVVGGNCLQLISPRWIDDLADVGSSNEGEAIEALQNFQWNLGSDVKIEQLIVRLGEMVIEGEVGVNP